MQKRHFSNNAATTIVSDLGSTITVASAATFPTQYPFFVTAEDAALNREVIRVNSSPSANNWSVTRAQEGTTQRTFTAGNKIEIRITAGYLNEVTDDIITSVQTVGNQEISGKKKFNASIQEKVVNLGAGNNIDISQGTLFTKTITGNTTFTVTASEGSDTLVSFVLEITNGGSATVTWWNNVKWKYGIAPTLVTSGMDVLGFYSKDGGTNWVGMILARDVK